MKIKRIALLIICILATLVLTSCFGPPDRYEGYVIDFVTKEPIPYAEATCRYLPVLCDENGYFNFSQISLITNVIGVLDNITATNYGKLVDWSIYSDQVNYVPLHAPDTVYGYVELNGQSNIRLEMEGDTYKATAELNEAGEYTFYNVPTEEVLYIYAYKGEKRSINYDTVFKSQEGDCKYEVITAASLQFEE